MLTQIVNLTVAMYEAIGPGFVLAGALPLFLVALVLVVRGGARRVGRESEQG